MHFSILSFAVGVMYLQMQAHLPSVATVHALAGMACIALRVIAMGGHKKNAQREGGRGEGGAVCPSYWRRGVLLLSVAALGFAWAGWRAHLRLSEALPVEWEGKDITLTGIVAGLPQRFAQGERFEFEVESVQTPAARVPRRIQLAWYDGRGRNRTEGKAAGAPSMDAPGRQALRSASHSAPHSASHSSSHSVLRFASNPATVVDPGDSGASPRVSAVARAADAAHVAGAVDAARQTAGSVSGPASAPAAGQTSKADPMSSPRAVNGRVRPGERWRLTVRLRRPHGNANPQGFDYEAWLLERNIRALGAVRPGKNAGSGARNGVEDVAGGNVRLNSLVMRPGHLVERMREIVRERFFAALPDAPYRGVLLALAIGDQRSIPGAQWILFSRTGVTHLVSISGLHVTMLAALFAGLANWLWRRSERLMLRLPAPKAALLAGWLAACAYALLAGFEVPVQRTLFMLGAAVLALCSGRNFGASRILLFALLVVLLIDPWAVLSIGFWLSFGAVAALLYAGGAHLGRPAGWRALALRWGAMQWAVTVACLPLLLLFFQQFSLVSPLANALAIPLVSLFVTPLTLLCAALPWPWLLHADHWLLAQLMAALHWLSAWPVWQQPAPPVWTALLALVGVAWLLLPRGFPARWLGGALLLPALFWQAPRPPEGEAWVDVLDVGQGLAVVVRTAKHNLLYDAGPRYGAETDAGQRVVAPFLRATGVGRLDTLLISHSDADHAGGLASILASLPVARMLSSAPDIFGGEACAAGQRWEWDGVRFSVLHPDVASYADVTATPNRLSCVVKVDAANRSALLTGDIDAKAEAGLLARAARRTENTAGNLAAHGVAGTAARATAGAAISTLRSDVVVAPHHGSRGSSTPAFLAAVGAREAIFSAGYRNAFGHPHAETLARHAARGSRLWRTDADGAVHVRLAMQVEALSWRQIRRRYWHAP